MNIFVDENIPLMTVRALHEEVTHYALRFTLDA